MSIDTILIQHGIAWEIWRDTPIASVPPMTAELTAQLVEFPAGTVNERDTWDGTQFHAQPLPVPASISDRQFFQQLAVAGTITQNEALAAVKTGTVPASLQAIIDAMPDAGNRFNAEMLIAGATIFQRAHPLTEAIGAAQGMTSAQIDDLFRAAAQL